jgi:hypothetical protein
MNAYQKNQSRFHPDKPPFSKGDKVFIDWAFSNGIGGKRATVESCEQHTICESGWIVKIDLYPNPIDSNWLNKLP